jgi:hypothetical protein
MKWDAKPISEMTNRELNIVCVKNHVIAVGESLEVSDSPSTRNRRPTRNSPSQQTEKITATRLAFASTLGFSFL